VVVLGISLGLGFWHPWSVRLTAEPISIENVPMAGESQVKKVVGKNYVASKNGTKYYLPTCAGVKRIKAENKIWFNTVAEAQARGLTPATNCPGL